MVAYASTVDEQGPFPRRTSTRIVLIVVSMVSVIALCLTACWIVVSLANDVVCSLNGGNC